MTLHRAHQQQQQPPPSLPPLLALPSELRNTIYEYILIQNLRIPSHTRLLHGPTHRICANILLVCKQLHAECTPILYGSNTFLAHSTLLTTLPSLILFKLPNTKDVLPPVIYPNMTRLIRKFFFHVRLDIDARYTRQQATQCFSGVQELEVEVFQPSYGTCDFGVLALLEGVRGVGKAVVGGSVGDGKYARWLEGLMMSAEGTETGTYEEEFVGGDQVSVWQLRQMRERSAVEGFWDLDG